MGVEQVYKIISRGRVNTVRRGKILGRNVTRSCTRRDLELDALAEILNKKVHLPSM
jgi:hypothetical protein